VLLLLTSAPYEKVEKEEDAEYDTGVEQRGEEC
jgi:hypothetical protein